MSMIIRRVPALCQHAPGMPVIPDPGSTAEASRYLVFAQVAEADGNRTRQRCGAALTSFEDWGDHQVPKRLRVDSTDLPGAPSPGRRAG